MASSDYRGELHSLRARIGELEGEVDKLEEEHRIGPSGETQAAKAGYAFGRRVRRTFRRWFGKKDEANELERLRERAQVLERIVADAPEEPIWGPPESEEPTADTSAGYRAGKRVRNAIKGAFGDSSTDE